MPWSSFVTHFKGNRLCVCICMCYIPCLYRSCSFYLEWVIAPNYPFIKIKDCTASSWQAVWSLLWWQWHRPGAAAAIYALCRSPVSALCTNRAITGLIYSNLKDYAAQAMCKALSLLCVCTYRFYSVYTHSLSLHCYKWRLWLSYTSQSCLLIQNK